MSQQLLNLNDEELTFKDHLQAFFKTVFLVIGIILAASVVVHYFIDQIQQFLLRPLGEEATPLQFLNPMDPLFFILRIDFTIGFLVTLPFTFFIIWRFISPAIKFKNPLTPYLVIASSVLLSVSAGLYTYLVLTPIILKFMSSLVLEGTMLSFTASGYFSFLLSTLTLLILIFQIPLVIVGLTRLGIIEVIDITGNRRYIYAGLLIATAFITPTTDIVTLFMVALPAVLVVEVGVIASLIIEKSIGKYWLFIVTLITIVCVFGGGYYLLKNDLTIFSHTIPNNSIEKHDL
ncbi:twin-arginine translocase subunit TatC [Candidatus Kaiserbacteria bacterium]|nr:twin-arginine translocase subunit TatC [Candidatus Kaiserbacteria bacterium]